MFIGSQLDVGISIYQPNQSLMIEVWLSIFARIFGEECLPGRTCIEFFNPFGFKKYPVQFLSRKNPDLGKLIHLDTELGKSTRVVNEAWQLTVHLLLAASSYSCLCFVCNVLKKGFSVRSSSYPFKAKMFTSSAIFPRSHAQRAWQVRTVAGPWIVGVTISGREMWSSRVPHVNNNFLGWLPNA